MLTFANHLARTKCESDYHATITKIQEKVRQMLRKDHLVGEEVIAQVPIVTAGHFDPILKYEAKESKSLGGWDNRLFLKALEQVDPEIVPTLFEVRHSWEDLNPISGDWGSRMGYYLGTLIADIWIKYVQWLNKLMT